MKNQFRVLLCFLAIATGLLMTSCEKDDTTVVDSSIATVSTAKNKAILENLTIDDLSNVDAFLSQKIKGKRTKSNNEVQQIETVFGTVLLDQIKKVTDHEGHINYTFLIQSTYYKVDTFYNLVLHQFPDTDAPEEAYVLEYKMSERFLDAYLSGSKSLKEFQGVVSKYMLDDFMAKRNRASRCEDDQGVDTPCEIIDVDLGGSDGDGDSNSNGDPNDYIDVGDTTTAGNGGGGSNSGPGNSGSPSGNTQGGGPNGSSCTQTTISACCTNNFCDPHGPRRINTEGELCSGSYSVVITVCNNNKAGTKIGGSCDDGGGTVGVLLRPDSLNTLSRTVGDVGMDYLKENCNKEATAFRYWINGAQTSARAELIKSLTFFWRATENSAEAFNLSTKIMNAESTNRISFSEAIELFELMKIYDRDSESFTATEITLATLINNNIYGPYDASYFDTINEFYEFDSHDPNVIRLFTANCIAIKLAHPDWSDFRVFWEASKEMLHLGLDLGGLIPAAGIVCDLTNATIYAIEGDGVNATLSTIGAIPILGWFSTGAKYASKGITLASGAKTTLKWFVTAENIITFGSRSKLRKVLEIPTGDTRRAHHIIPWRFNDNPIVQAAAKITEGWHPNSLLNGKAVEYFRHSGSHGTYDTWIRNQLDEMIRAGVHNNPQVAYNKLKELADLLKEIIDANPNIKINELPLP